MMKKLFFLILFLGNSFTLFAQEKTGNVTIDSLIRALPSIKVDTTRVNVLSLIAEEFKFEKPDMGIEYANKALLLSKSIKWDDGIAKSLINFSEINNYLSDLEIAKKNLSLASKFAKSTLTKSKLYKGLGNLYFRKTDFAKALEYSFRALKLSEEIKNQKEIASNYLQIGNIYASDRNPEAAMMYIKKALNLNLKLNLKSEVARTLSYLGEIYRRFDISNHNEIALNYFRKSQKLSAEIKSQNCLFLVNFFLTQIFQDQNKFDEALKHIEIAKNISVKIGNYTTINACKYIEASIYQKIVSNNPKRLENVSLIKKAIQLVNEVKIFNEKKGHNINLSMCYKLLSELYTFQKDYKKVSEELSNYIICQHLLYDDKSKETIKNLEDQRTIDLKNKEIEINKITLESKEKQKWFYIIGIGFLGILGGLFFYQSRKRKKTNERLQFLNSELELANKAKVKFLSILNHDLRSPVYNFIHFMQLQKESPELLDTETKNNIETKTINSAENLLASMEDLLLWSKGQMDNFKPQPQVIAVNSLFEDTKKHFESEEKVTIEFENSDNIYINTDENFLKTIIRNLTGNAIKATKNSEKAKITWKAWQENDTTYLSITDSGSGMSQEKFKALYDENEVVGIKSGLGLHLIRDLAKAINCKIVLESNNAIGTSFTLELT